MMMIGAATVARARPIHRHHHHRTAIVATARNHVIACRRLHLLLHVRFLVRVRILMYTLVPRARQGEPVERAQ